LGIWGIMKNKHCIGGKAKSSLQFFTEYSDILAGKMLRTGYNNFLLINFSGLSPRS
jgi:hypothetical protein